MKILKLEFQNINSLKGTTTVNFESQEYTGNRIFLITGPTGAGKTSIFDAMCLALYGRTPRMNVSGGQNDVLTRGEKKCKAELLFEIKGKRYLASWSQHISSGGILQGTNHEISDQTNGGVTLASGVTSTKNEIKRLIGLEFDQFCKTVHIAQGEFDEFLEASPTKKMEIFTKITGQGRYEMISMKAKRKLDDLNDLLERLGKQENDISVLSEEELKDLERHISDLEVQKDAIVKQIEENKERQHWLGEIADLTVKLEETKGKITELKEKQTAFAPKAESLRRALEACTIEGSYGTLVTRETHLQDIQRKLEKVKNDIPQKEKDLKDAEQKLEAARVVLTRKEEEEKDLRPKISLIRTLNGEISTRRATAAQSENTFDEKKRLRDETKDALDKTKDEIAVKKDILQKIGEYIECHAAEVKLAGSLESIESGLTDLEGLKQRVAETVKKLRLAEGELGRARKEFEVAEAKIQSLSEKQAAAEENVTRLKKEREILLGGKTPNDLDEAIETVEREVTEAKTIASLDEHRKELEDGKPCPLCGAVHHPYAEGNVPNTKGKEEALLGLKEKRRKAKRLDGEIQKADAEANHMKIDLTAAQGGAAAAKVNLQACEKDYNEKKDSCEKEEKLLGGKETEIRAKLRGFGLSDGETIDSQAILSDLKMRLNELQAKEKEKSAVETELAARGQEETGLRAALDGAERALTEAETACRKARSELEAKEKERAEIFGDESPDAVEERLQQELAGARDALDAANEAAVTVSNGLTRSKDDEKHLTRDESQAEEARKEAERLFNDALKAKGFESREEFDDARLEESERKLLQDEKEALDRENAELNGEMKTRQEELNAKRNEKKTEKSVAELREECAVLEIKKKETEENLDLEKGKRAQDMDRRKRFGELQEERIRNQKEMEKWREFWAVIGPNSKSFSNYAQSLTFEQVIRYANLILQLIMPRYLLIRRPQKSEKNTDSDTESGLSLELNVIDRYQGDEQRVIENLSGGERFIISLALALGISRLAEKNAQIDSLFLDEGFGTLDEETLEKAIAALMKISENGKMIGIITHVEMLQGDNSPIETKIRVKPIGATGHSVVEGPGVTCNPADIVRPSRKPRKKREK